jgi:polar amino acid transport system permease protein|tara:strand:+ start:380 stop:1066 length:687 start_codon:yes stop_codon:yes gene_type:complete
LENAISYIEFLINFSPKMLTGIGVTIGQLFCASALAIVIALIFGLMRLSSNKIILSVATIYIEFFRGTSLLIQLYWIYYVLPLLINLNLDAFNAGFIALGLNFGAYGAEIVRGSIQAVPRAQWEAGRALNMSPYLQMRRIIIPQTFSHLLPPASNLLVELLKATALVSLISVTDLMFMSKVFNQTYWMSLQVFGTALIIYYILARFFLTPFLRWLEVLAARKMGKTLG